VLDERYILLFLVFCFGDEVLWRARMAHAYRVMNIFTVSADRGVLLNMVSQSATNGHK